MKYSLSKGKYYKWYLSGVGIALFDTMLFIGGLALYLMLFENMVGGFK